MTTSSYPSRTGGMHSQDMVHVRIDDRYHTGNCVYPMLLCGGCLDAPEVMAAGSCNSTTSTNWRGHAVPTRTITCRDDG